VSLSVRLSVHEGISGTTHAIFTNFLRMLPVSVAQSSCGILTIGHITYRQEGVFFPLTMHYNALAARGIIRSPITLCSTRDHSVAAAVAENGIGREGGDGSAQAKCNLRLRCLYLEPDCFSTFDLFKYSFMSTSPPVNII